MQLVAILDQLVRIFVAFVIVILHEALHAALQTLMGFPRKYGRENARYISQVASLPIPEVVNEFRVFLEGVIGPVEGGHGCSRHSSAQEAKQVNLRTVFDLGNDPAKISQLSLCRFVEVLWQ